MAKVDTKTPSPVIELSGVAKHYQLYKSLGDRLKSAFLSRSASGNVFRALDDVSLVVRRGEFLGVIGRNGSGKSTLLELVCGISQPSEGSISVNGTVSALLELGAGFNPELSGHDNVYLNGNILGLSNRDIDKYYDRIVDFADIGDFLHEPVKIYSSGMYVRLAFAVQACIEPDVLIVDEALAVGDIFFRQKCYQYIDDLIGKGTTVILVTHAMGDIEQFCTRALLLDHGKAVFVGDPAEAVKRYYLLNQPALAGSAATESNTESLDTSASIEWPAGVTEFRLAEEIQLSEGRAYCTKYTILDETGQVSHSFQHGASLVIIAEFILQEDIPVPVFGAELINDRGIIVHGKTSLELGTKVPQGLKAGSKITFEQKIGLNIAPGEYTLTFGLSCITRSAYESRYEASHSDLYSNIVRLCNLQKCVVFGVHFPVVSGQVHLQHHGIADLPGECRADYGYLAEDSEKLEQINPEDVISEN